MGDLLILRRVPKWLLRMLQDQPPIRDMRVIATADQWGDVQSVFECRSLSVIDDDTIFPPEDANMAEKARIRTFSIGKLSSALDACSTASAIAVRSTVDLQGEQEELCKVYSSAARCDALAAAWPMPAPPVVEVEEPAPPPPEPTPAPEPSPLPSPVVATAAEADPPQPEAASPEWLRAPPPPTMEYNPHEATTSFYDGSDCTFVLAGVLTPVSIRHLALTKATWPRIVERASDRAVVSFELVRNTHILVESRLVDANTLQVCGPYSVRYNLVSANSRASRDAVRRRRAWTVRSRERQRSMQRR